MAKTPDLPVPVEECYRSLLRGAVERAGGQGAVARLAGINQATVSRTLRVGGTATYAALMKLSRALDLPVPLVAVRDDRHALWCRLGALLEADRPLLFEHLLQLAYEGVGQASTSPDSALDRLREVVSHPLPSQHRKSRQ